MKDHIYTSLINIVKQYLPTHKVKLEGRYLSFSNFPVENLKSFFTAYEKQNDVSQLKELEFTSYNSATVKDFLHSPSFNHKENCTLNEYKIDTAFYDGDSLLFQIYQNEESFIETYKTLIKNSSKLDLPIDFYLIDEKYRHSIKSEKTIPSQIEKIYEIQRFTKALGKIADFQDTQDGTVLYFRATEKQGYICDLRIDFFDEYKQDVIDIKLPDDALSVIDQIQHLDIKNNLADKEKKFIFSSSISEFLYNKNGNRLIYLIEHWDAFKILFDKNYQVYTQGKSLNELKVALAEEQIKLSDNITKGVIDILGKALILPMATAAFLVFRQSIQASGYGVLISIVFCFLIVFITLSIVLGTNLHSRVVDTLDTASKFVNNEDKNQFKIQDKEYLLLDNKLSKLINKTKKLLKIIRKTSIIFGLICLCVLTWIQIQDSYFKGTDNDPSLSKIQVFNNSYLLIPNSTAINTEKSDHSSGSTIFTEHDSNFPIPKDQ